MTQREIFRLETLFKTLPVEVVYLYGSQAKGEDDFLSDFDFGFLFLEKLSKKEKFETKLNLFGEIAKRLNVSEDKIDVVDLEEVPILLQFNAICGKVIYCQSNKKRVFFESYVMARYHDEHYYLDREFNWTLEKLEKGDYFERRLSYS